jgi:hypothetical protein
MAPRSVAVLYVSTAMYVLILTGFLN